MAVMLMNQQQIDEWLDKGYPKLIGMENVSGGPFIHSRDFPTNIKKLQTQILDQGTTGQWTGQGYGGPERNAYEIASILDGAGITDIKQFGRLPDGSYGNKTTGQPIRNDYSRAGGNIFSGTFIGEDSTGFGVQFGPDGTPYFYTQQGASTSSMGDIVPVVSLGLALFAPGIGGAIGSVLTQTAATTLASQVVGAAIVQGVLAEAQGGDFLEGAIRGAVTAGVAPTVANTVGTAVADVMADSAIKSVVANAVASSASSAVTAALTGGDVDQAALTGAIAGAGGTIGRQVGTAAELGTTPFSEQTQMLAAQEQGLGTTGGAGSQIGQAAGAIATGSDPLLSLISGGLQFGQEVNQATPTSGSSGFVGPVGPTQEVAGSELDQPLAIQYQPDVPGLDNIASLITSGGEQTAGPSGLTARAVEAMPQMQPRENENAGPVIADEYTNGGTFFYRDISVNLPNGEVGSYRIEYHPSAPESRAITYTLSTESGIEQTWKRPDFSAKEASQVAAGGEPAATQAQPDFAPEQFNILDVIQANRGNTGAVTTPITPEIVSQTPIVGVTKPVSEGQIDVSTAPVVTTPVQTVKTGAPSTQEISIPDQISQELNKLKDGVDKTISPLDKQVVDLITQTPELKEKAVDALPVKKGDAALDISDQGLIPLVVDNRPVLQNPLLGLSTTVVGDGEQTVIDQANLDALDALSSAKVDADRQKVIDQQILDEAGKQKVIDSTTPEVVDIEPVPQDPLLGLLTPTVTEGEPEIIDQDVLDEEFKQDFIDGTVPEDELVTQETIYPYIKDFYISTGRRRDFGPTVTTLGQALSAPFFPSTPVSGLTSYRGAGEIESQRTGKPRRNVWNESSLRLTDALGL